MKLKINLIPLLLLLPNFAQAYIPPARYILHTYAKKHIGFTAVQIRSSVTAIEDSKPTATHFIEVTRYDAVTASLKSWVLDDAGNLLYMAEHRTANIPASASLLLADSSLQMSQALTRTGVSLKHFEEPDPNIPPANVQPEPSDGTQLKRWNKRIAWVLGVPVTATSSMNSASLWVEKDSFFPIRLVGTAGETQATFYDIQWDDYRYYQQFPYPRTAVLYFGGSSSADSNSATPKSPYLRADLTDVIFEDYTPPGRTKKPKSKPTTELALLKYTTPGFTDLGNAAPAALHALIETYYQIMR